MSKVQIIFSKDFSTGIGNTINQNIDNHFYKNSRGVEMRQKTTVRDSVVQRFRPRGKAYTKLWCIQFDKHGL